MSEVEGKAEKRTLGAQENSRCCGLPHSTDLDFWSVPIGGPGTGPFPSRPVPFENGGGLFTRLVLRRISTTFLPPTSITQE
jgi:hypothetical protein